MLFLHQKETTKTNGYEKVSIVYGIDGSHNDSRCAEK
jgi:hypothetical protein